MRESMCSIDGCGRPEKARGWCAMHYARWSRHGHLGGVGSHRQRNTGACSVDDCARPARKRGMCSSHYERCRREGEPEPFRLTPLGRWASRVDVGHPLGCWQWTGVIDAFGYGRFRQAESWAMAHRAGYELLVGPIGDATLDHLCRNRSCVNPDHLERVTVGANVLRGQNPAARNARKAECLRGHPLAGVNLYVDPNGGRRCRECMRASTHRWRNRQRKESL